MALEIAEAVSCASGTVVRARKLPVLLLALTLLVLGQVGLVSSALSPGDSDVM